MGRHAQPFEDSIRSEIYRLLVEFVVEKQAIPNQHSFWKNILCERCGYRIPWGSFQYHFMKLQIERLVEIEPLTKSIKICAVELKSKES